MRSIPFCILSRKKQKFAHFQEKKLNLDKNEGYMQIKTSASAEFAIIKNWIDKISYV